MLILSLHTQAYATVETAEYAWSLHYGDEEQDGVGINVLSYNMPTSQTKPSPSLCNDSSVVYGATNFDAPKFICTPRRFCAPPP